MVMTHSVHAKNKVKHQLVQKLKIDKQLDTTDCITFPL